MFDLETFDREITRRRRAEIPGDDVVLSQAIRPHMAHSALGFGQTAGALAFCLVLGSMTVPMMSSASQANDMTFQNMNLQQFAVHMNMQPSDPYLVAMFEELCMV